MRKENNKKNQSLSKIEPINFLSTGNDAWPYNLLVNN